CASRSMAVVFLGAGFPPRHPSAPAHSRSYIRSMTSALRKVEWAPVVITLVAVGVAAFGVRAYYLRGDFGVMDTVRCALLLIPAALFLLVSSYVFQHARLLVLLMVFLGAVLVRGS